MPCHALFSPLVFAFSPVVALAALLISGIPDCQSAWHVDPVHLSLLPFLLRSAWVLSITPQPTKQPTKQLNLHTTHQQGNPTAACYTYIITTPIRRLLCLAASPSDRPQPLAWLLLLPIGRPSTSPAHSQATL